MAALIPPAAATECERTGWTLEMIPTVAPASAAAVAARWPARPAPMIRTSCAGMGSILPSGGQGVTRGRSEGDPQTAPRGRRARALVDPVYGEAAAEDEVLGREPLVVREVDAPGAVVDLRGQVALLLLERPARPGGPAHVGRGPALVLEDVMRPDALLVREAVELVGDPG